MMPKYPIYIPSRARHENPLTANVFYNAGVPFKLVVEPVEYDDYASLYGEDYVIKLPFDNVGVEMLVKVRNWIFEYSVLRGEARHWQIDDNIRRFYRRYKKQRIICHPGTAIRMVEEFTDRYTNIGLSGMNYSMFCPDHFKHPPFRVNTHVYSVTLLNNSIPYRYRGPRNEDVDMCLQVLSGGLCTVAFNAFLAGKQATMTMKGGNSHLYKDDGRLLMSRVLERRWPGVVQVRRRFGHAHHFIFDAWKRFDTPLIRRDDIDWDNLPKINEYDMVLKQSGDRIIGEDMNRVMSEYNKNGENPQGNT